MKGDARGYVMNLVVNTPRKDWLDAGFAYVVFVLNVESKRRLRDGGYVCIYGYASWSIQWLVR